MPIGVERDRDGRVPGHVRYRLQVDAPLEKERRAGVAEVMEAEARQPRAFDERLEGTGRALM